MQIFLLLQTDWNQSSLIDAATVKVEPWTGPILYLFSKWLNFVDTDNILAK